jgi:hypothetical protein
VNWGYSKTNWNSPKANWISPIRENSAENTADFQPHDANQAE